MQRTMHFSAIPLSRLLRVALLTLLLIPSGCRQSKPEAERTAEPGESNRELIAIIDLNVVAQEIGARAKINADLTQRENELVGQLNDLKSELGKRRDELKIQYGDDLNQQQQSELDRMLTEHQQTISLQTQAAQSQLAARHAQLKVKLLNEVRPVAYEIARENGMNIVMTTSQIYAAGPNVDITQKVIKRIKSINASKEDSETNKGPPAQRVARMPGGGDFMPQ